MTSEGFRIKAVSPGRMQLVCHPEPFASLRTGSTKDLIIDGMKRREFLEKLKNVLLSVSCGTLLSGCEFIERSAYSPGQMAYCLGYLIYGNNPPSEEVGKLQNLLQAAVQSAPGLQSMLERIYFDIMMKALPAPFENLSPESRKNIFNAMLPVLLENPEVVGVIDQYLEEERVLKVIDYPDIPGGFGECGWLVLENEVWDRYYKK